MNKVEQALTDLNAIAAQAEPLIGIVGIAVRGIASLLRSNGKEAEAAGLEAELATAEANRTGLRAALDAFHAKYPAGSLEVTTEAGPQQ